MLPSIQAGLGISHGVAGALSAIPVLCMGIFAPLAPLLARRLGARWALAACAILVIGFGLLRLSVPGPVLVLALTFGVGLGMGLAGPIFPLVVRREMPARPALGTGAYAIGLVLGSTIAAAVAVPLAGAGGDWRFALGVITLAGLGPLALWLGLAPPDEVADATIAPPRIPWRSPIGWVLGILFGLQSMLYYGVVTWLAAVYVERGWSEPDSANLIALFGAVTLVGTAVMPLGADRIGTCVARRQKGGGGGGGGGGAAESAGPAALHVDRGEPGDDAVVEHRLEPEQDAEDRADRAPPWDTRRRDRRVRDLIRRREAEPQGKRAEPGQRDHPSANRQSPPAPASGTATAAAIVEPSTRPMA